MRHLRIGHGLAIAAALSLSTLGPAAAEGGTTAEQTIDVMNRMFGSHAGLRANHAKGIVVEGSFTPAPEASGLSKASLFQGPPVPVTVRFSNATGLPTIADGSPRANPHGMAVKFKLADGADMDVVVNALKFFPVATGEEFRDLLTAAAASGPGVPKPTPLESFVASHPNVPKASASAGTPSSLARQVFNGINAFVLVDKDGKRQPFRFRFDPEAGEEILKPEEAAKQAPDFLMQEIVERIGKGAVRYAVRAQLAEPGDSISDATKPWPEDRRVVTLGTLSLTKAVPDSAAAEKALLFMPNALTEGIEASDDPLIDARVQAYVVSFGRRAQ